jgi:hypothetical protein
MTVAKYKKSPVMLLQLKILPALKKISLQKEAFKPCSGSHLPKARR